MTKKLPLSNGPLPVINELVDDIVHMEKIERRLRKIEAHYRTAFNGLTPKSSADLKEREQLATHVHGLIHALTMLQRTRETMRRSIHDLGIAINAELQEQQEMELA